MLNSFQLKLVKFTKNEQNKNKLCKHTVSLLKQHRRNNNKNSKQKLASTPCHVRRTLFTLNSIISSPVEDGKVKSKESQSYIILNTIAQSQFHTEIEMK